MPPEAPPDDEVNSEPAPERRPNPMATFASLKIADYRWLWIGSIAMHLAMNMQMVARGWLVLRQTDDSPLALVMVVIAFAAPMAIFSPIGGALADRFSKKKLVTACLLGNAVMTLLLATLDMLDLIRYRHLLAIGVVNGTLMAVNVPSRHAIISDLVPDGLLMNAVSLANSSMNVARIAGPAVAGVLILYIDTWGVFYLIAMCYVMGALSLLVISKPIQSSKAKSKNLIADAVDGFSLAARDPRLRGLLVVLFVPTIFGFSLWSLLPVWAKAVLGVQSDGLGYLMTAMGIGALAGSLALASSGAVRHRGLALMGLTLLSGIVLLLFGGSRSYWSAMPLLFLNGLFSATMTSLNMTLIQQLADANARGRILSITTMLFGAAPLGAAPMGALAETIGTPAVFAINGAGIILFVLIFILFNKTFRSIH
jgi:MFS family permease